MNKGIGFAVAIIILLVAGYFIYSNSNMGAANAPEQEITPEQGGKSSTLLQKIDRKASFAIFTNGTFRVFTASMYHNLSQDVYIEANNPNLKSWITVPANSDFSIQNFGI